MKILGIECWRIMMRNKIQSQAIPKEFQEMVAQIAFYTYFGVRTAIGTRCTSTATTTATGTGTRTGLATTATSTTSPPFSQLFSFLLYFVGEFCFTICPFSARGALAGVGLPLGNLTSQLLVNIYMNEFYQFMKRDLKVKYYIRYADGIQKKINLLQ